MGRTRDGLGLRVMYGGEPISNNRALRQIGDSIQAYTEKQRYAPGTTVWSYSEVRGERYYCEFEAQEPGGPVQRLGWLDIPKEGLSDAEFTAMFERLGLKPMPDDLVVLGGDPKAGRPDTVRDGRRERSGASRNDPCPCGSGKKYKRCCLQ